MHCSLSLHQQALKLNLLKELCSCLQKTLEHYNEIIKWKISSPKTMTPMSDLEVRLINKKCLSSVQFSRSVMSDSLQPHRLQHATLPCPSPTPRVHSNSRPSSWWCHPAISSSVVPFSSCPQPLPASGSFPMSQLFTWGGQSIGVSALASVLPMNIQEWFPLGLVGSPCSPWDSQESSPTPQFKSINSLALSFLHSPTLTSIHDHWKNHSLD